MSLVQSKHCTRCLRIKPLNHFHRDGNKCGGYRGKCAECTNTQQRNDYHLPNSKRRAQMREYALRLKCQALELLGGTACALCGEKATIFLTVDHADKNGYEHRKKIGCSGTGIHRWIIKATPKELKQWNLRVLCGSCQMASENYTDTEIYIARHQFETPLTGKE